MLNWFTQICLAVKHVHDRKILHRDIKAQNVFMMKSGMLKLGDFGIARVLSTTSEMAATVVGTPYYLSPEIVQSNKYGFSTDIWSLGVLLYEMCALRPPFNGQNLHMLAMQIVSGLYPQLPECFSPDMKNLVKRMLMVDDTKRPNINELIKFPCIASRVQHLLSDEVFQEEFSHTVLHRHNVFDKNQPKPMEVPKPQQDEITEPLGAQTYFPDQDIDPIMEAAQNVLRQMEQIQYSKGERTDQRYEKTPAYEEPRQAKINHGTKPASQKPPSKSLLEKQSQPKKPSYEEVKRQREEELQQKREEIYQQQWIKAQLEEERKLEKKRKADE